MHACRSVPFAGSQNAKLRHALLEMGTLPRDKEMLFVTASVDVFNKVFDRSRLTLVP